jgi:hypothetical protein
MTSVVLSRHKITNERRSVAPDDSRLPTDENKNGMNAAGSVMKAAGQWTKAGRTARSFLSCANGRPRGAVVVHIQVWSAQAQRAGFTA